MVKSRDSCFAIIVLISLGLASLYYSPLSNLWPIPPNPITIWAVVVTAILMLISIVFENGYLDKLFALVEEDKSSGVTTIYNENGEVVMKFKKIGRGQKDQPITPHKDK